MKIEIFAKNIKMTEGIRGAIEEKLNFLNKFLKEETPVSVTIRVEKESQIIKLVTAYESQIIEIEESTDNLYKSIDKLADTLKMKLSKIHSYKIDYRKKNKDYMDFDEFYEPKEEKKSLITKRKAFKMKPMSEEEAILQMNLLNHPSFMFINSDLDFIMCLVYKKKNGSYGIIEGRLDED